MTTSNHNDESPVVGRASFAPYCDGWVGRIKASMTEGEDASREDTFYFGPYGISVRTEPSQAMIDSCDRAEAAYKAFIAAYVHDFEELQGPIREAAFAMMEAFCDILKQQYSVTHTPIQRAGAADA
ncbi:hypothetical protein AGMMS49992_33770 [Clostridia bacterium]|nr:hypothetical protein AGMMS49992_33770 [Clostridia bacterium]